MKPDILDSSAWIEVLDSGPNTPHFAPIIARHPDIIVPAIIITEIRKFIIRERSHEEAEEVTRSLLASIVVQFDEQVALSAADLSIKHKLPLADSIIYATALNQNATLWTQDIDFKGLPNVKYFPKKKT